MIELGFEPMIFVAERGGRGPAWRRGGLPGFINFRDVVNFVKCNTHITPNTRIRYHVIDLLGNSVRHRLRHRPAISVSLEEAILSNNSEAQPLHSQHLVCQWGCYRWVLLTDSAAERRSGMVQKDAACYWELLVSQAHDRGSLQLPSWSSLVAEGSIGW